MDIIKDKKVETLNNIKVQKYIWLLVDLTWNDPNTIISIKIRVEKNNFAF